MLVINYKNNTPQQKYYAVGVKQNNNANKVKFVLKANQDGIDLQNLTPYLKLQNKEHTYLDKIELETIYKSANGIIEITWLMTRKSMQHRYLEAQLVFEDNEEDIVWQTLIVELELNETIDADEEISEANPTILQQLQGEVKDVASMRDVLKNIKYEYNEQYDQSRLIMPKGILPLKITDNPNGMYYYFDYGTEKIIDDSKNQVGTIHIWDSIVYLDFDFNVAWEYHESEHEKYAIDYAGLDGDECKLNTYILYNVPTPEDKTEVLSKMVMEYIPADDETHISFPKNVAPLVYFNDWQGEYLYFDYNARQIVNGNSETIGDIETSNDIVVAIVGGHFEKDIQNDEITFIYFNNMISLNSLNLYKDDIVSKISYATSGDYLSAITFPKGIIPITATFSNHSVDFDYRTEQLVERSQNQEVGYIKIDHDNNQIRIYDMTDYQIIGQGERIVSITFLNTDRIGDFAIDFHSLNAKTLLSLTNNYYIDQSIAIKRGKIADANTTATSQTSPLLGGVENASYDNIINKPQNTIFKINDNSLYGGVIVNMNSISLSVFQQTITAYTFLDIGNAEYLRKCIFLPNAIFKDQNQITTFINEIKNLGGFAIKNTTSYKLKNILFIKTNNSHNIYTKIAPLPKDCLVVEGIFKHEVRFDVGGNERIDIINNVPFSYNKDNIHYNITSNLYRLDNFIKCVCFSASGNNTEIYVLKITSDGTTITCQGFDNQLLLKQETFNISDLNYDSPSKLD